MLAGVLYVQISYETWSKDQHFRLCYNNDFDASTLLYIVVFAQVINLAKKK